MQHRVWIGCLGVVFSLAVPSRAADCPGVLATNVKENSVSFDIGIRDGDTLHSWRFVDAATAQGIETSSPICSVFDMWRLTMEVSPRGPVEISGLRNGMEQIWRYDGGPRLSAAWEPNFLPALIEPWELAKPLRNVASAEAEQAWTALLELAEIHAPVSDQVWIQVERSFGLATHDHPEEGNEWFARAIDLADGEAAWMAAHIRWTQGRRGAGLTPQTSTALVEAARESWLSQGETLSTAHAHEALGGIAYGLNDFEMAEDLFLQSEGLRAEVAPNSLDRATALQNIGVTASIREDLPEAIARTDQARRILKRYRTGNQLIAASSNLSAMYGLAGQTDRQVEVGEDALRLSREIGLTGTNLAAALINLSTATVALGDLARGEALAKEAVLSAAEGSDPEILAAAHHGVAWIAEEQGNYEVAEKAYRSAIEIRESIDPPPPGLALSQVSLGIVMTDRGRLAAANEVFQRAEQYLETQAPDHFYLVVLHAGWARLLLRQGSLSEALNHSDLAVERSEGSQLGGHFTISANLLRGRVLLAMERFDAANEQADRTLALARRVAPKTAMEAQALELQGRVAFARGRWTTAAEALCLGVEILENQINRLGRAADNDVRFRSRHLSIFEGCAEATLAAGDTSSAFHVLERSRAWKTRQTLAQRGLLVTGEAKGELQARVRRLANRHDELLARLSATESADTDEEVRSQLETLNHEREELLTDIRAADPRYAEVSFPTPLDAASASKVLQPREILVAFEVTKDAILVFALDSTGELSGQRLEIDEQSLHFQVDEFLAAIETRAPSPRIHQLAALLYQDLLEPLKALPRAERLVIVADGPLLRLPWSALGHFEDRSNWRWLIEDVALFTVPSATVYAQLIERPRAATERIVAFGDATIVQPADGDPATAQLRAGAIRSLLDLRGALQPLPGIRDEIRSIERAYVGRPVEVLLGADATETRARQLDPRQRIIHFAGHAILDEENPLESGLVLATPETVDAGLDNGFLQAWEITDSLRLNADLVTLSACSTARGPELRGEGLQGLSQAFLHAGARSVLGTLWPVADRSTARLMATFYRESAAGLPRDQALRRAQLEMIRGKAATDPADELLTERGVGDWRRRQRSKPPRH